jgi:hypothetical protein
MYWHYLPYRSFASTTPAVHICKAAGARIAAPSRQASASCVTLAALAAEWNR